MQVVTGPTKAQTKCGWLCTLLQWTNITHHGLITRNIWPEPETNNNEELSTMPMHENKWATDSNSWNNTKDTAKAKPWPDSSTKKQHPDQYLPLQQPIDQISATTHTDQHASSQRQILTHPSQQTTSGLVPHTFSYQLFGARNAIVGLATMKNFMTNAYDGKQ
jgi:hypothetical protein